MSFLNSVLSSIEGKSSQTLHRTSLDGNGSVSGKEVSSSLSTGLATRMNASTCHERPTAGHVGSHSKPEINRYSDNRKLKDFTTSKTSSMTNHSKGVTTVEASGREGQIRTNSKASGNPSALKGSDNEHSNPRKGTYQEILARARTAQETKSVLGIIKHKPAEKLKQREKLKQNAQQSYKTNHPALSKPSEPMNKTGTQKTLQKDRCVERDSKKRQRIDLGYKGTMRPSSRSPAHVSSAKFGTAPSTKSSSSIEGYRSRLHRASEHSKTTLVPDVEQNSESYSSDASSDMEAAAFDLEEEEQQSLSVARKEDEAAAAEELELRHKKAERRKMLAQMAATVSKKRKL